jgi:hypothetical protein
LQQANGHEGVKYGRKISEVNGDSLKFTLKHLRWIERRKKRRKKERNLNHLQDDDGDARLTITTT